MFDAIAPRYELVNRVMTLGLDQGWRRRTVHALALPPGSTVVDLACGTGDLCRQLERAGYGAVGVDLSLGMLVHARTAGPLVEGDAARLPFRASAADGAVSGFALRNFADLDAALGELARIVRPGGRIALLDVAVPCRPVLRAGHAVYFGHVAPRIGALLSDPDAYRYLPRSVAYLPPTDELLTRIGRAGFGAVERQLLSGGITQLLTATRTSPHPARCPR
jgi:demethylmenaquinone methyltransferase/2-methoxy-6-polyprenyl-1,4-benzoquinol methylase